MSRRQAFHDGSQGAAEALGASSAPISPEWRQFLIANAVAPPVEGREDEPNLRPYDLEDDFINPHNG